MPFSEETCHYAARGGHMGVLKYLQSEGVPFDGETCLTAAIEGHLEVLQWLRSEEVDCPWDIQECLSTAEEAGEVIQWIESFLQ